ncbi:D-alanyl-D-alanine carboxypeptidase family protein [Neobacillus sp. DY30]|uniref:D-alanyl-D-alanine carboxypeptidase family protein n=1 Tax=Neobacillus sp. DY30 TaxID=3047871 RepID=UPI0024C09F8E|nr:D-alanyl-D-alanine carboxypeptidase family protein [Neobacillus sp. DY30]WHY00762.1 D-alanyl-D-alanine carboxypeptidase family protein [Neobacillus sp. DY30]
MNKLFYRKLAAASLAMIMFFSLFAGINKAEAETALDVNASGAILVDADTGMILYEKNSETALGIASMTKMMTEYLLLEAVKEGKVKWNQEYVVSPDLSKMSHDEDLSNVYLRVDAKYKVEDLYAAMAIESANAATIAIAEVVGGSEAKFVEMMNNKAAELGLEKYKFVNSTGLNNRDMLKHFPEVVGDPDEENIMSAKDVAILASRLLHDFPEVLETSSIPEKTFAKGTEDEFVMDNWNWMLEGYEEIADRYPNYQQFVYDGLDGLKTGSTPFAGYNFTGTASRDGQRYISVVMNTSSQSERFRETRKILDFAFNNFKKEEIIPKHYQVKGNKTLPVIKGKENQVKIYTKDAVNMVVKNGEKDNFKTSLTLDKKKVNKQGELTAPIKKGEKVGTLTIQPKEAGNLGFLTKGSQIKVDVIAAEDVEKANWFVLMMRGIGGFFGDLWGGISSTVKGWF